MLVTSNPKFHVVSGHQAPLDTSMSGRKYEFFVTTKEPHQPEGIDRGLIRRVVMLNFFEDRRSDKKILALENQSKATIQRKTGLKSRFRLPKPEQSLVTDPKLPNVASRTEPKKRRKDLGENSIKRSYSSSTSTGQNKDRKSKSSASEIEAQAHEERPNLVSKIDLDVNRLDPIDILSVPGSMQLDVLLKLYKTGSRVNSLAINARKSWGTLIYNDVGLLHATLATWALYHVLVQGDSCLQVVVFKHKSEAIKEINRKIDESKGRHSDELIGTVATLANFENLFGAYDTAQLHTAALKQMIHARGGFSALRHNDGLLKGILWVDIHTATAFRSPPSFPKVFLDAVTPVFPDQLLNEAAYTSPTSLLNLSISAIECFNVFYRLHRLALAISSRWIDRMDPVTFSDLIYEMEYMLLSVPDYSRDFIDFDLDSKHRDDDNQDYTESAERADAASIVEGLLAAAQIFVYAALREMPPTARLFSILLQRLRVALDRPNVCAFHVWWRADDLHMLLWSLVVAASMASNSVDRGWWIQKLFVVVDGMGIETVAALQRELERVAWTDVFFGDRLEGVWQDVRNYSAIVNNVTIP